MTAPGHPSPDAPAIITNEDLDLLRDRRDPRRPGSRQGHSVRPPTLPSPLPGEHQGEGRGVATLSPGPACLGGHGPGGRPRLAGSW